MKKSIHPFLSEILDYAGLYPPAALRLKDAFAKYIQHSKSNESWMLSKFVVGTNFLDELEKLIDNSALSPNPFPLTIVSAPSTTLEEFKKVVQDTKTRILGIIDRSLKEIKVPSLEIKLPTVLFDHKPNSDLAEAIEYVADLMNSSEALPHQVFFEIPGFEFQKQDVQVLIQALSAHNNKLEGNKKAHYSFSGLKVRCGGVEAFQFPSPEYLAYAIHTSAQQKIPLKFTAGLHHPVRHYNDSVSTKMHGFLNVFGASILCHANSLSEAEILAMLNDEDPSHFSFSDTLFGWKDNFVSLEEIHMLRALYVTSFGSCSFDDPVEDLQELTILT